MEYISAEEFLKQPVEVQKVFIDWWKPSIGDLFSWIKKDDGYEHDLRKLECCNSDNIVEMTNSFKGIDDGDRVPLLTEGQLRKFIEDKIGCIINVSYKHKPQDGYMKLDFDFYEYPGDDKYMIYISTKDIIASSILEAYWKVACQIAKED